MRTNPKIRQALDYIERLGFVVLPSSDGETIDIVWLNNYNAPDITDQLETLQTDPDYLGLVLTRRKVKLPLWFTMGYPWDQPLEHWRTLQKTLSKKSGKLEKKKLTYVQACLEYYVNRKSHSWREIAWNEPWPIAA